MEIKKLDEFKKCKRCGNLYLKKFYDSHIGNYCYNCKIEIKRENDKRYREKYKEKIRQKKKEEYKTGREWKCQYCGKKFRRHKTIAKRYIDHLEKQGKDINLLGCELCHRQDASVYDFHHIVFKSEAPHHPELNNPRNIIYVCRSCHMFLHGSKRENRKHLIKERKLDELFSTGSKVPIRLY